MGDFLIHFL